MTTLCALCHRRPAVACVGATDHFFGPLCDVPGHVLSAMLPDRPPSWSVRTLDLGRVCVECLPMRVLPVYDMSSRLTPEEVRTVLALMTQKDRKR